jgi:hypothetical protein
MDPPLLYASGRSYARLTPGAPNATRDGLYQAVTMAAFWGVSVSLYANRRWTRPIWRACLARSGRDWMLNSGVLRLDPERAGPVTHAISGAIFATYPVWLWLGVRDGRREALPQAP